MKVPCGTCRVLGAAGGPVSSLPRMSKRLSTGSAGVRVRHELLVITRCQPDPSPLLGAAGAPREVLFRGLLCPARTACMGGKGVWVQSPIAQCWLHWRSPVPSLRFEHGVVLPSKGAWGWRNGRCQRPNEVHGGKMLCRFLQCFSETAGLGVGARERTVGSG